jgi:hypothetical protein
MNETSIKFERPNFKSIRVMDNLCTVGRISLALETYWYEPLDINSESDHAAALQVIEFNVSIIL